jgi:uncharacterized protein YndB with AHSA1/START domain
MALKTIEKSIDIHASSQKIWEVLFTNDFIREWYTAFGEGIIADTDWQSGSKAIFTDTKGNGILGRIVENGPGKKLEIEYDGYMVNGMEDFESQGAKATKGAKETYTLQPVQGGNRLRVTCDMEEYIYDHMSACWDNALKKVKTLAEQE